MVKFTTASYSTKSRYAVTGRNWYGYDMNWFNNTAGIDKNICIRAVVSGNTVPKQRYLVNETNI